MVPGVRLAHIAQLRFAICGGLRALRVLDRFAYDAKQSFRAKPSVLLNGKSPRGFKSFQLEGLFIMKRISL